MQLPKHLKWKRHNGSIYLYAEYRYLSPDMIAPMLSSTLNYISNTASSNRPILHMVDVEGTGITARSVLQFSQAAKKVRPFLKKSATVGLQENYFHVVYSISKLLKMNIEVFNKKDLAAQWLVSE